MVFVKWVAYHGLVPANMALHMGKLFKRVWTAVGTYLYCRGNVNSGK